MKLSVFDPNITRDSPAGSCLLEMLAAAAGQYEVEIYAAQSDLPDFHKLPTPARPVLLQNIVFSALAVFHYLTTPAAQRGLTISTQGAVPFCHICYAHNPHKLFLTRYRHFIGGGFFTRGARILNYGWIASLESIAFRRARWIVVPSAGLAAELAQTYGSVVAAKLRVIANPVDCQAFVRPDATSRNEPAPTFTFIFCALGNFEWKGLRLILEALATGIAAQLLVVGGTAAEIRRFGAIAEAAGVARRVTFAGMQRNVRPFLWRADAFVFPSLHESFGLVCLQAAAAGLPIIATDLYALDNLLKPGLSGWRVDRTTESVANAMRAAMADPARTIEMGQHAQRLAQTYDVAEFQRRWLDLLAGETAI